MKYARPLPDYLVQRYHGWKATRYAENAAWYRRLADEGQRPRAMVIACCDSRVNILGIFGMDHGEVFVHRNVANLVPPSRPDGDYHGTSAAVEYAVNALHIADLIVLGHSGCGGVKGCHDMCSGAAPELDQDSSFIGRWMDILRPGYDRLPADLEGEARLGELERQAVLVSLDNLMTFPFVEQAVTEGKLALHGLWIDIGSGDLEAYNPRTGKFSAI